MHPTPLAIVEADSSHHPVLRTGVFVGFGLCVLSLAWLLVANHVPFLEPFALVRNLIAAGGAGVFLLVPVGRFHKSPGYLFLSGLIAWTMLTLAYGAMGSRFPTLEDRLGTFHLFMLGSVAYGLIAAAVWVTRLIILSTRQPPSPAARRRTP